MSVPDQLNDYYLIQNEPNRRQFYPSRAEKVRPSPVAHTAENILDIIGDDAGAENVAEFISNRTEAGSYHVIVDSDSVVWLIPPQYTAFGARHYNSRHVHFSFACRTTDWVTMSATRREGFLRNGAQVAHDIGLWLEAETGSYPPSVLLDKDAVDRNHAGFVTHARLDPARRSDPGRHFPWSEFFSYYDELQTSPLVEQSTEYPGWRLLIGQEDSPAVRRLQSLLNSRYATNLSVDGDFGPNTQRAVINSVSIRTQDGIVDECVWNLLFDRKA